MAQPDRLTFDITRDLERIDAAMTRVVLDPDLSDQFRRDPNGIMVKVGMHPSTSPEVNDRVNRVFYAAVINSELNGIVSEHFRSFRSSKAEEYSKYHEQGLDEGRLQNRLEYDLEAADHLLRSPETLYKVFNSFLQDLNNKGILTKQRTQQEIETFVTALVSAIQERKPISEHPRLEEWDRNYGVGGFHFGAEVVEVGPVATVAVFVEIFAGVTVAITEEAFTSREFQERAFAGDRQTLMRIAMASRVLQFRADLMLHAFQFEARR